MDEEDEDFIREGDIPLPSIILNEIRNQNKMEKVKFVSLLEAVTVHIS